MTQGHVIAVLGKNSFLPSALQPDTRADEPTDQPSQNRRDIKTIPALFHLTTKPRHSIMAARKG